MRGILLFITFIIIQNLYGQSLNGTSGLLNVPSARMLNDGEVILGASYIPKPYFQRYNRYRNPGLNTYLTYAILPFVEIMFRYTHELNVPVNISTTYFPDRMFSLRLRLVEEKKIFPSILVGFNDISSFISKTCNVCTNYNANYLVSSKDFSFKWGDIDLTTGYAFNLFNTRNLDLRGFFWGFSFTPMHYNWSSLIFENDSKHFNMGIRIKFYQKASILFGYRDLKKPTFSLNFSI